MPRHAFLKYGNAWARPGHYVSNGPYLVKSWIPNDHITLVKNPRFYDAKNVHIDTVNYYAITDPGSRSLRVPRFYQFDTQNPFPNDEIDWMRANMPDALKIVPYLGTAYIVMNVTHKPLNDVHVREAINLAFDRESLVGKVRRIGEPPAYHIVPPGTANSELSRWQRSGFQDDAVPATSGESARPDATGGLRAEPSPQARLPDIDQSRQQARGVRRRKACWRRSISILRSTSPKAACS